jgi:hypothetical protein
MKKKNKYIRILVYQNDKNLIIKKIENLKIFNFINIKNK